MELSLLFLSLLLGFKHSFDADHLLAVGSLLKRVCTYSGAARAGISWAAGHMLTASLVTVALYFFSDSILPIVLPHLQKVVACMLIALGLLGLRDFFFPIRFHAHESGHSSFFHGVPHIHRALFGIGVVHGLASNDELLSLLLISIGVSSLGGLLVGITFFSLGVVAGMVLFSLTFSLPFLRLHHAHLTLGIAFFSAAYGFSMLA